MGESGQGGWRPARMPCSHNSPGKRQRPVVSEIRDVPSFSRDDRFGGAAAYWEPGSGFRGGFSRKGRRVALSSHSSPRAPRTLPPARTQALGAPAGTREGTRGQDKLLKPSDITRPNALPTAAWSRPRHPGQDRPAASSGEEPRAVGIFYTGGNSVNRAVSVFQGGREPSTRNDRSQCSDRRGRVDVSRGKRWGADSRPVGMS